MAVPMGLAFKRIVQQYGKYLIRCLAVQDIAHAVGIEPVKVLFAVVVIRRIVFGKGMAKTTEHQDLFILIQYLPFDQVGPEKFCISLLKSR
jgi:hypothetical protein